MKLAQKKMLKLYGTRWHYMFLAEEASDFIPWSEHKQEVMLSKHRPSVRKLNYYLPLP